jgi:hypothetical protein
LSRPSTLAFGLCGALKKLTYFLTFYVLPGNARGSVDAARHDAASHTYDEVLYRPSIDSLAIAYKSVSLCPSFLGLDALALPERYI